MENTVNCETCGLDHKFPGELQACATATLTALRRLVAAAGEVGTCKGCGVDIFWIRHVTTGKNVPYTVAGQNHFVDCSARDRFKK